MDEDNQIVWISPEGINTILDIFLSIDLHEIQRRSLFQIAAVCCFFGSPCGQGPQTWRKKCGDVGSAMCVLPEAAAFKTAGG